MLLSVETQRHFDDAPGKVVQDSFSQNVILNNRRLFSRVRFIKLYLPGMGFDSDWQCGRVPSCECSNSASSLIECLCCVSWLQRLWQKLVDVAVQAWGSSSEALVILSQTRAMLAHLSNKIHCKVLHLAHAIGWNDGAIPTYHVIICILFGWLLMREKKKVIRRIISPARSPLSRYKISTFIYYIENTLGIFYIVKTRVWLANRIFLVFIL